MKRFLGLAAAFAALTSAAPAPAPLKLWRLDCGSIYFSDLGSFADSFALDGKSGTLPVSCYLIKHGEQYLLWDTGLPADVKYDPNAPIRSQVKRSLVAELADMGLKPSDITYVAVSHYHGDHAGQADSFPGSTLLIGRKDFDTAKSGQIPLGGAANTIAPWTSGGSKAEPLTSDRDVFGDKSVVMLTTPGHTPGHMSLLVRLPKRGPLLLVGDLWHQAEQKRLGAVAAFNTDRADTLASYDRLNQIAKATGAEIIIGHEAGDVGKLPAFPAAAE